MGENEATRRRICRLAPCPSYDVEGMESWLSELAQEGLLLEPDGFFVGLAFFSRAEPCAARYRLEAAQRSTSLWSENGGEPDEEQLALGEKYGWNYVAKRGDFYIYRSLEPSARELNTDPKVQALALNAVKKRQISALVSLLFWILLYPLLVLRSGPLLTILQLGTWRFLLCALLALWFVADSLQATIYLGRLQRKLREGLSLDRKKNWRKRSAWRQVKGFVQLGLVIALALVCLQRIGSSALGEDRIPLDQYAGELPFPTMTDFVGEEAVGYRQTMYGVGLGFHSLREWSDWLAPRCIDYAEHACVDLADGSALNGGLYVEYYQLLSPALAKGLAMELHGWASREQGFAPLELPALGADYAVAYTDELHFPNLILQRGNVTVHVFFSQTSETFTLPLEDWAQAFAAALPEA